MNLTINHDTRYLQSIPGDELGRYIDGCMTQAYATARRHYREELQQMLEAQARDMYHGQLFRVPLPVAAEFCIGECRKNSVTERITYVEFTADQIRAFSNFLTGLRP